MKYKNMKDVSIDFCKKYKVLQKLGLHYDHREYFK